MNKSHFTKTEIINDSTQYMSVNPFFSFHEMYEKRKKSYFFRKW